jgi:hypothetical protein
VRRDAGGVGCRHLLALLDAGVRQHPAVQQRAAEVVSARPQQLRGIRPSDAGPRDLHVRDRTAQQQSRHRDHRAVLVQRRAAGDERHAARRARQRDRHELGEAAASPC